MEADRVRIFVDGTPVDVPRGTTVAAALLRLGTVRFRESISGEPRGPLCAMGICFECVVTVNRRPAVRSCLLECAEGMEVDTHG
ncbi:MAG: (2Fe-2S)-binding protein [Thermoplasmata archaeon]